MHTPTPTYAQSRTHKHADTCGTIQSTTCLVNFRNDEGILVSMLSALDISLSFRNVSKRLLHSSGGLNLDALRSQLRGQSSLKVQKFESDSGGSTHSGGYDATVTAEVFLLELDIWIRFQQRKKAEKQVAVANDSQNENSENREEAEHVPATNAENGQNTENAQHTEDAPNTDKAANVNGEKTGLENGHEEKKQNDPNTQEIGDCCVLDFFLCSRLGQENRISQQTKSGIVSKTRII